MKPDSILQADLLDLVFENRNKAYGAYPLRKFYEERVYKALAIILIFLSALSVYSLLHKRSLEAKVYVMEDIVPGAMPPAIPEKIHEQKPKQPIASNPKTMLLTSHIRLVDSTEKTGPVEKADTMATGSKTSAGYNGFHFIMGSITDPGDGAPVEKRAGQLFKKSIDKNIPLSEADIMPSFPGGTAALMKYLQRNLDNPGDMNEAEPVLVKIRFIVGYDGKLKGFEVIQNGGEAYNNEVIRVLKKMPDWTPGITKGENVSVYYTIPVKFAARE